jgi:hypothetical protein
MILEQLCVTTGIVIDLLQFDNQALTHTMISPWEKRATFWFKVTLIDSRSQPQIPRQM